MKIEKKQHKPSKLTGLYKQQEKLVKKRDILKEEVRKRQNELGSTNRRLKAIQAEIESINTRETIVTTHAIERYQERIENIPAEEVIPIILTDKMRLMIDTLGNGTYPGEGFRCTVVDNKIVTILEP